MHYITSLEQDIQNFMSNNSTKDFSFETGGVGWKCYKHSKVFYDDIDPYQHYKFMKIYVYDKDNNQRVRGVNEVQLPLSQKLKKYGNILITASSK